MSVIDTIKDNTSQITSLANTLKNSVTISGPSNLAAIGAVGIVATAISVGVAAYKSRHIVDETKCRVQDFKEFKRELKESDDDFKTKVKKFVKELTASFAPMALEYAKKFAIPLVILILTEVSFRKSYNIMLRNEAALAAAYASLSDAFKNYRANVVKDQGKEKDIEYMTSMNVDEKSVQAFKTIADCNYGYEDFIFDPTCDAWDFCSGDVDAALEYARTYACVQMASLNRILHSRVLYNRDGTVERPGYLFINEILSVFTDDISDHPEGQITGILYYPDVPWETNEVNFGNMPAIQNSSGDWGIQIALKHDGYILDKLRDTKGVAKC